MRSGGRCFPYLSLQAPTDSCFSSLSGSSLRFPCASHSFVGIRLFLLYTILEKGKTNYYLRVNALHQRTRDTRVPITPSMTACRARAVAADSWNSWWRMEDWVAGLAVTLVLYSCLIDE